MSTEAGEKDMKKGTIKTLKESFGFITVEGKEGEEPRDLFFHQSECSQFESFEQGDEVEFEIGKGRRGDDVATVVEKVEQ